MSIASQKSIVTRFALSWLLGSVCAYFFVSYFSNFYSLPYQFILLSLLFQLLVGTAVFLFFDETLHAPQVEKHSEPLAILTLFIALTLSISAATIGWQFPGLFHRRILFMDSA
ncbi:MAG: hypothetical protein EHM33_32870, partial [Chloroflexi bacterium]